MGVLDSKQGRTNVSTAPDLDILRQGELEHDERQAGEAAKYGIFFDDRHYDYQRHLRVIGEAPDAVFIPATTSPRRKEEIDLARMFDAEELARNDGLAADADDDPVIKEVLEALEDEAYEDENFEDDFVVKLDRDGDTAVLCPMDTFPIRTGRHRWGKDYGKSGRSHNNDLSSGTEGEESLSNSDDDQSLTSSRKGISYAASVAMTSIDTKFDQIMRLYDEESDDISEMSLSFSDDEDHGDDEDQREDEKLKDGDRQRALGRAEVEAALEEFLLTQRDYIRPSVEERRTGAVSLLNELRQELGPLPASILDRELSETPDEDALEEMLGISSESESDHFDCQSIITTYTNTENLPGIVREPRRRPPSASATAGPVEIRISRRTGMPITIKESASSESEGEQVTTETRGNRGEARNKRETAEEKRARKAAVKEERRQSRVVKKELKVRFQLGKEVSDSPASGGKPTKKPLKSILRA